MVDRGWVKSIQNADNLCMKTVGGLKEKIYREWLPAADYALIPDYEIENYLPGDPTSRDYVCEICIPVRKAK